MVLYLLRKALAFSNVYSLKHNEMHGPAVLGSPRKEAKYAHFNSR